MFCSSNTFKLAARCSMPRLTSTVSPAAALRGVNPDPTKKTLQREKSGVDMQSLEPQLVDSILATNASDMLASKDSTNPVTNTMFVDEHASLAHAATRMWRERVGVLMVADKENKTVVGIISERDFVKGPFLRWFWRWLLLPVLFVFVGVLIDILLVHFVCCRCCCCSIAVVAVVDLCIFESLFICLFVSLTLCLFVLLFICKLLLQASWTIRCKTRRCKPL